MCSETCILFSIRSPSNSSSSIKYFDYEVNTKWELNTNVDVKWESETNHT